jgi:hypothetical protein
MKSVFAAVLLLVSGSLYAVNIVHLWSLGDAGFEYVTPESGEADEKGGAGLLFSILKFNWMDTDTGIGVSLTMTAYRQYEGEISWPIPPLELMWNPVSIKTPAGYLEWGLYDRAAWFTNGSAIDAGRVTNSIGTRFIFSSHPFGKTTAPHRGTYHVNRTLFFEYEIGNLVSFDSANNTFRVGITIDIGILAASLFAGGAYLAAWPFTNTEQRKGRW